MSVVYFIGCASVDLVKVGYAVDPYKRLSQHQTGCPLDLSLDGYLEGSPKDERAAHAALGYYRARFEWFQREPALRFMEEARERGLQATCKKWKSEFDEWLAESGRQCEHVRKVARLVFEQAFMEAAAEHGMAKLLRVAGMGNALPKKIDVSHLLNLAAFLGPDFMSKLLAPVGQGARRRA